MDSVYPHSADCRLRLVSGVAPWVLRIDDIKAATAVNVEAERKVAQLNDEMQALARTIGIKDQTIQETGVKVELMERRMKTVKKRAGSRTWVGRAISTSASPALSVSVTAPLVALPPFNTLTAPAMTAISMFLTMS